MTDRFESMRKAFNESQQNMSKEDVVEFTRKVFDYGIGREEANVSADDFVANLLTTQQKEIDGLKQQSEIIEHNQKPIVPQFIAGWHEANKDDILSEKFKKIASDKNRKVRLWYQSCFGPHNNNIANAQEIIAKMDLYGYEVEEEPKWVVAEGDLVIKKGEHEAKVYFVEYVTRDDRGEVIGILLVNGIQDRSFGSDDDEPISSFFNDFRLLAKERNLEKEVSE